MSGTTDPDDAPRAFSDEEPAEAHDPFHGLEGAERRAALDWVGENLPLMRRSAFGQRLLYQSLAVAFVLGLAAQVGGYALRSGASTGPMGLVADLLYALGWSLWTGVVVTVFVQVIPEWKRRQFKAALDLYQAAQRDEARVGSEEAEGDAAPGAS
jgi:hypothetical protein